MAKQPNIDVRLMATEDIQPYPNNPRVNDDTVQALVRSIKRYGFNQPIVVDKKGVIIKGHARYRAAVELGMEEIPTIVSTRPANGNRADRIADNAIHDLSRWDDDALSMEMRDVESEVEHVMGKLDDEYAVRDVDIEVQSKDLEQAQEKLGQSKRRTLIRIICPGCGAEMFLDRTAVENLE